VLSSLIIQGKVLVDDAPQYKAGMLVVPTVQLRIRGAPCKFVSRCVASLYVALHDTCVAARRVVHLIWFMSAALAATYRFWLAAGLGGSWTLRLRTLASMLRAAQLWMPGSLPAALQTACCSAGQPRCMALTSVMHR
jgi:hypothetical protein